MTKRKWWIIGLIVLSLIILGIEGKKYMDSKKLDTEMVDVVKSDEAKLIFEKSLKRLDSKALTPSGKIQSYTVDYDSIKHNPMGGINVTLYVNNDEQLEMNFTLDKINGSLRNSGVSYSNELDKFGGESEYD